MRRPDYFGSILFPESVRKKQIDLHNKTKSETFLNYLNFVQILVFLLLKSLSFSVVNFGKFICKK